jgi:hypothetical protein
LYCNLDYEDLNIETNSNVGDTLILDIKAKWNLDGFDAVIGNPPYQDTQTANGKRGGGDLLWNKFIIFMLRDINKNGFLVFVHPAGWRKPESEKSKYKKLFKLMTCENQMVYLEIHNTKDGLKMFGCGTRYDWYVIQKKEQYKNTIVKDETGITTLLNLKEWYFLPNYNFEKIQNLLIKDKEPGCGILFSRSSYGSDNKKWMNETKTEEYKYPCIHATLKNNKVRYYYSKENTKGHFGIKKIIFGETGINRCIIDENGNYGMTQQAMGITYNTTEDGNGLKNALESNEFKIVLDACSWSNYRIDWRMFKYFKNDFWKELV